MVNKADLWFAYSAMITWLVIKTMHLFQCSAIICNYGHDHNKCSVNMIMGTHACVHAMCTCRHVTAKMIFQMFYVSLFHLGTVAWEVNISSELLYLCKQLQINCKWMLFPQVQ